MQLNLTYGTPGPSSTYDKIITSRLAVSLSSSSIIKKELNWRCWPQTSRCWLKVNNKANHPSFYIYVKGTDLTNLTNRKASKGFYQGKAFWSLKFDQELNSNLNFKHWQPTTGVPTECNECVKLKFPLCLVTVYA